MERIKILFTTLVELHTKNIHTKNESSGPYGFGEEDFRKVKIVQKPRFGPHDLIMQRIKILFTILVENLTKNIHTKHESSGPYGFGEEDFQNFNFQNPILGLMT